MHDNGSWAEKLTAVKWNPEKKNSDLNGIRTHDLCDTATELYQLSYQAKWKLVTLWVHDLPVDGEEYKWNCFIIAEVMGSNPVQPWIFFRFWFHNC